MLSLMPQQLMRIVLVFQGPPGTGKTTSILALAHGLLGTNYREGVLELNASDDRCTTWLGRLHRQMQLRQRWMQQSLVVPRRGTSGAAVGC